MESRPTIVNTSAACATAKGAVIFRELSNFFPWQHSCQDLIYIYNIYTHTKTRDPLGGCSLFLLDSILKDPSSWLTLGIFLSLLPPSLSSSFLIFSNFPTVPHFLTSVPFAANFPPCTFYTDISLTRQGLPSRLQSFLQEKIINDISPLPLIYSLSFQINIHFMKF